MSIRKGNNIIAGSGGSGSGSAMNVDNITTELNQNDEIQAIGVLEKNDGSVKYDWVGTESEWIAGRSNGSIEDDWICYIIDDNVASNKRQRTIGEIIFSLFPLTDVALHLLDGSVIDGTGVYNQFYTFMKNLYDNGYDKCFTTEANWQSSVTNYGVCGKFVLDTSNQTIRLPMVEGFIEGTLDEDAVSDLIEAGLPNITGRMGVINDISNIATDGAFHIQTTSIGGVGVDTASSAGWSYRLDASRSSSIYGNSDTVQPQAIKGYYYIVLATNVDLTLSVDTDAIINDVTNLQTEVGGADYVVEYQMPTAENSYSWYRLYKSGWIEQGGMTSVGNDENSYAMTFLKTMADTNYFATYQRYNTGSGTIASGWIGDNTICNYSTTSFSISRGFNGPIRWKVEGMAASSS